MNPEMAENIEFLKANGCEHGIMENMRMPDGSEELVLFGPLRYLMLRHHAALKTKLSKFNPSEIGTDITRQSGSGRQGNLKIGYQEGQAYFSMGTPHMLSGINSLGVLREVILLCETCGTVTTNIVPNRPDNFCSTCMQLTLRSVSTLYSLLVLLHAMASRGIDMKLFPVDLK